MRILEDRLERIEDQMTRYREPPPPKDPYEEIAQTLTPYLKDKLGREPTDADWDTIVEELLAAVEADRLEDFVLQLYREAMEARDMHSRKSASVQ